MTQKKLMSGKIVKSKNFIIIENNYKKIMPIGKGTFGIVWMIQNQKTKKFYAQKVINKNLLNIKS